MRGRRRPKRRSRWAGAAAAELRDAEPQAAGAARDSRWIRLHPIPRNAYFVTTATRGYVVRGVVPGSLAAGVPASLVSEDAVASGMQCAPIRWSDWVARPGSLSRGPS